jgi:hypothetical protein
MEKDGEQDIDIELAINEQGLISRHSRNNFKTVYKKCCEVSQLQMVVFY